MCLEVKKLVFFGKNLTHIQLFKKIYSDLASLVAFGLLSKIKTLFYR
jgi:hypothetical protein